MQGLMGWIGVMGDLNANGTQIMDGADRSYRPMGRIGLREARGQDSGMEVDGGGWIVGLA